MKIAFGKAELTLSEKGLITDITFHGSSIFPAGRTSCLIRVFADNNPMEIRRASLENGCLTFSFEGVPDTVSLLITQKGEYTVFEVESCPH